MPSKQILDSRLFIRLDLSEAPLINQVFANNVSNKAHFASQILLYDKLVIPTTDFGIVPALVSWFGITQFKKILRSNTIQFLRRDGLLAYSGGGNGISDIILERGPDKSLEWWQEAIFAQDDISLEIQLVKNCPALSKKEQTKIIQDVLKNTRHLLYDNDFFIKNIAQESYLDIIKSPSLIEEVNRHAKKRPDGLINLEMLDDVLPDQIRILPQDGYLGDVAALILRVAEINMELLMASQTDNADLFTSHGAEKLLKQKLIRAKIPQRLLNGFVRILDLKSLPDVQPAIIKGELTLSEIWKIRQSSNGKKFREWLRQTEPRSARDLERAYVDAIGKSTAADALPTRIIRFATTNLVGIANPAIGIGAGVFDSFFLEQWLKGYSPKLFFDDLQKLVIQNKGRKAT